ncbi:hypothetical protein FB451DRAFT_1216389, partial [Mycena latifolia]
MIYLLGRQYQFQDEANSHWRQASLDAANHLQIWRIFNTKLPSLNLSLLPGNVQRAVKGFCEATGRVNDRHNCYSFDNYAWGELDSATRERYAAAYALLYSTDAIPLFNQDGWNRYDVCDACNGIRQLYRYIDALSAGQVLPKSNALAKVLGSIKQLTIVPEDSSWDWNDDWSDWSVSEDDSANSPTPGVSEDSDDELEEWDGSPDHPKIRYIGVDTEETHHDEMLTSDLIDNLGIATSTDPEAVSTTTRLPVPNNGGTGESSISSNTTSLMIPSAEDGMRFLPGLPQPGWSGTSIRQTYSETRPEALNPYIDAAIDADAGAHGEGWVPDPLGTGSELLVLDPNSSPADQVGVPGAHEAAHANWTFVTQLRVVLQLQAVPKTMQERK